MQGRAAAAGAGGGCEPYPPIAEYAVIGDCHTAALISRAGSIDWYCPVRFDAPAVFCRLLDARRGGFLRLAPVEPAHVSRRYRGPTNVLETTFEAGEGTLRVTDFMPVHARQATRRGYDVGTSRRLVRLVEGLRGTVEVEVAFKPSFNYAQTRGKLALVAGRGAVAEAPGQFLTLACSGFSTALGESDTIQGRVKLAAGERVWVVLTHAEDPDHAREALNPVECDQQLQRTLAYWQEWADHCSYRGRYQELLRRSALVLKLLTYEPTGGVVAAPTTSLPEEIGGVRNWDYRYTWLRDSALMLYALLTVGYTEEAADFFEWLRRTCGDELERGLQIMYAIDGSRQLPERVLAKLDGYCHSRPVRIGNAAARQNQLDIYGEVLRSAYVYYRAHGRDEVKAGRGGQRTGPAAEWPLLRHLVDRAAERWREPDYSIWEVRGGPRHFLYSKLMCWAALEHGARLAREHGLDAPLERWERERDQVRAAILERGYNAQVGAFTQAFDSGALDAAALAIPRIGFLPGTDPRVTGTIDGIRAQLTRHGLVHRYTSEDGLPGGEAAFVLSSFWMVDALSLAGRLDEAHALFERVVSFQNDLGLLAEEIDPVSGALIGNFPQGFSHMALINAAVNLAAAEGGGAEEHARSEGDRAQEARRAAAQG